MLQKQCLAILVSLVFSSTKQLGGKSDGSVDCPKLSRGRSLSTEIIHRCIRQIAAENVNNI